MTPTAALLPFSPPRNGLTIAKSNARRVARATCDPNGPPPIIEPVRVPWRWNPARHERMGRSRSA